MNKQSRFLAAGVLLCGVVGYLMVTGMKDSMTYFLTPVELTQRLTANPSFAGRRGCAWAGGWCRAPCASTRRRWTCASR